MATTFHIGDATTDCENCVRKGAAALARTREWAVTADGAFLCPMCVIENDALIAEANNLGPDWPDMQQWRVVGSQVAEHDDLCAHCNVPMRAIEYHTTPNRY